MIFQSDIRRALAHFGQAPFFRYLNRQEAADETIEEIVVAATMLAAQKVGAIIAIEREIGLRNYIESGIPLDATLTYDLLVTIFHPGSALHDGAVILQENRMAAAACFLPLTVNPRVSRELGTRHRAAIGLTEEGDAVAVIVSEETGHISLAIDGRIERGLTPDALRERLRSLITLRRSSGRHGGRRALRCLRIAVVYPLQASRAEAMAVALATLLWLIVAGDHLVERSLRVPLEFRNIPTELEIVGDPPTSRCPAARFVGAAGPHGTARHRRGARSAARRVRDRGMFHLRNDEVRAPYGVEVAQVMPGTLALDLRSPAGGRCRGARARRRAGAGVRHRASRRPTADRRGCGAGEPAAGS